MHLGNVYKGTDPNDNSERTPIKDHFHKENLKTNEGIERVSVDDVKMDFSEYKDKENESSQLKKKREIIHEIKNFENVMSHKSKFFMEQSINNEIKHK